MKITAVHDIYGNITALAARPNDAPPAHVELGHGHRVSEIDAPDLDPMADPRQVQARLSELIQDFRVETGAGRVGFARKSA